MLDKAALAFIYFSIFIAVPAVFVKNMEWKVVISCKLNNNIGSIYCFAHELTSTSGEGLLTLDGSTQNTLTLFHCFVHLVTCTLIVVWLAYVVFGMNCKWVRVQHMHDVAHYHVILTAIIARLYTIYVCEGHCGIAGVPPRASQQICIWRKAMKEYGFYVAIYFLRKYTVRSFQDSVFEEIIVRVQKRCSSPLAQSELAPTHCGLRHSASQTLPYVLCSHNLN